MDKAIEELVGKASPWAVNLILLAIGALIVAWVLNSLRVLKNNSNAQNTMEKLLELQEEYNKLKNNNFILLEKSSQHGAIQAGIKSTYAELKFIFSLLASGEDIQGEADSILKSITDRISTDLKFAAGEIHRCAIWFQVDEKYLGMQVASAGFPDYYRISRTLEIDGSIAGRCFRTKTAFIINDVNSDRDFRHNSGSNHKYYSLICAPLFLGETCLGVITVDGKEKGAFVQQDLEVIETYAEIAAMVRLMQISSALRSEEGYHGEGEQVWKDQ